MLLIRHAMTDSVGHRLSGRMPGVQLNAAGEAEARALSQALRLRRIDAIYTSPLDRAVQTAEAIARFHPVPVRCSDDLQEIDFGEWTGRDFADLEGDARWRSFNTHRSIATVPAGEHPSAAQRRIVGVLMHLCATHAGETVVVVSHADIIRFALLHYLGRPLDDYGALTIPPASISELIIRDGGASLASIGAVPINAVPGRRGRAGRIRRATRQTRRCP